MNTDLDGLDPVQWYPVEGSGSATASEAVFFVPHAGGGLPIPTPLQVQTKFQLASEQDVASAACRVAASAARGLNLGGYLAGTVSRSVLDLDRPAGVAGDQHHLALAKDVADGLDRTTRRKWTDEIYRRALATMAEYWHSCRLSVVVYDNPDCQNPVIRCRSLRGSLDPLVPDFILHRLADPKLIELLEAGAGVELSMEPLDAGRIGPRAAAFQWLSFLKSKLGVYQHPKASQQVLWAALLDTSCLSAESDAVKSFLHQGRRAPSGQLEMYSAIEESYQSLAQQMADEETTLLAQFMNSTTRVDQVSVEVPVGFEAVEADRVGKLLASGIGAYLQ